MSNPYPWKNGDHLVICDSCGAQRYRSQCKYTWDGFLMCTVLNCWYSKHPLFEVPPVINDPQTITDVRPDQVSGTEIFVDGLESQGMQTKFSDIHILFGEYHKKFGGIDSPPDYI